MSTFLFLWGLTAPRLHYERPELASGHGGEANEDRGEPVVVRLREKLLRVQSKQDNAGSLGYNALHPDPDEPLQLAVVTDREGEAIGRLHGVRQRERDAANLCLRGHPNAV